MSRQHVDYQTSTNPDVNDGLDSGYTNASAIRPVANGETGDATTFKRPSENLRTRTEIVRQELDALKYLNDADRALLLTSSGSVTWNGLPTGTFSATANLVLKPFMAPDVSTAPRLLICAGTQAQITIRGKQSGAAPTPRAYNGANNITFDFTPATTGTGAITITATGAPATRYHVVYDDHATNGTTVNQIPANSFIQQFNAHALMIAAGLEAVIEGGGTPAEVGFPTPPASVATSLIKDYITGGEQATRYMSGAADAERHVITPATFTAFWAADGGLNVLTEGDVLCIWYDALVDGLYGGRRESTSDMPENSSNIPVGSLFLLRRFPARLPNALPVATVANGQLIFINGRVYGSGESGPLNSSGASYQGSSPNQWADAATIAAGSFESAIDNIVSVLGATTAPSGAHKIGIPAIAGSPVSVSAGGVHAAISNLVTGINDHIADTTDAHDASAISYGGSTNLAASDVEGALDELDSEKAGLALTNVFTAANTFRTTATVDSGVAGDSKVRIKSHAGDEDIQIKADRTSVFSGNSQISLQTLTGSGTLNVGLITSGGNAGRAHLWCTGGLAEIYLGTGANQYALLINGGNASVETDWKYQSARTFQHHLGLASMQANANAVYNTTSTPRRWENTGGSAGIVEGILTGIPSGATLTGLHVSLYNNTGGALNFTVDLLKYVYDGAGGHYTITVSVNALQSVPGTGTVAWYSITVPAETFPTDGYMLARVTIPAGGAGGDLRFFGYRITYTVTALVPGI